MKKTEEQYMRIFEQYTRKTVSDVWIDSMIYLEEEILPNSKVAIGPIMSDTYIIRSYKDIKEDTLFVIQIETYLKRKNKHVIDSSMIRESLDTNKYIKKHLPKLQGGGHNTLFVTVIRRSTSSLGVNLDLYVKLPSSEIEKTLKYLHQTLKCKLRH